MVVRCTILIGKGYCARIVQAAMRKANRGFTIIELLLVTSIILVILTLTVPALMTVRRKALIAGCKSNMHQIYLMMEIYRLHNAEIIPYLFYASEGMLDPEHMKDPETNASGLVAIVGSDRDILRCPADIGYGGVDYGLTSRGVVTCYSCFGQSYAYNNSAYTDPTSPYSKSNPARFKDIERLGKQGRIIMLTDFSAAWHGVVASTGEKARYFLNVMYFDGSVKGEEFPSDQEAKSFRNNESRRRWWRVKLE